MTWIGFGSESGNFAFGEINKIRFGEARGDASGIISDLVVIGLQGRSLSNSVPASGDLLHFNGILWSPISPSNVVINENTEIISSGNSILLNSNSRRVIVKKTVGSPTVVNMPNTSILGQEVIIKDGKGDALINNINIVAQSGSLIDGLTSIVLSQNYQSFTLLFDGSNWNII